MILLIDNYDSFSYNVYQLVGSVNPDIRVIRNDECSVEEIRVMNPSHIILSPGPGRPDKAGVCEEVIRALGGKIPILGICLGHQAICEVAGATVTYASHLMHGKQSLAQKAVSSVSISWWQRNTTRIMSGQQCRLVQTALSPVRACRWICPELWQRRKTECPGAATGRC